MANTFVNLCQNRTSLPQRHSTNGSVSVRAVQAVHMCIWLCLMLMCVWEGFCICTRYVYAMHGSIYSRPDQIDRSVHQPVYEDDGDDSDNNARKTTNEGDSACIELLPKIHCKCNKRYGDPALRQQPLFRA